MKRVCQKHHVAYDLTEGCKDCSASVAEDLQPEPEPEQKRGYICQSEDGKHTWFMGTWYRSGHDLLKEIYSDRCDDLIIDKEKLTDD